MIVLRTPKGWTGPRELDGVPVENSWRSHQVPMTDVRENPAHLQVLEDWLRSYRPSELFDERGTLEPRKAPGKRPTLEEKARKLLEADVEERPFAKLKQRQEYLHKAAGISVSESTLSRVIRSMGFGRKKGRWVRVSATSS
jgi:phosphoketolase